MIVVRENTESKIERSYLSFYRPMIPAPTMELMKLTLAPSTELPPPPVVELWTSLSKQHVILRLQIWSFCQRLFLEKIPSRLDDVEDIGIGDNDVLWGFVLKRYGDIAGTREKGTSRKLLLAIVCVCIRYLCFLCVWCWRLKFSNLDM